MELLNYVKGRAKEIILEKAIEAHRERALRLVPLAKEGNVKAHKEVRTAIDHIKALNRELIQTRRENKNYKVPPSQGE